MPDYQPGCQGGLVQYINITTESDAGDVDTATASRNQASHSNTGVDTSRERLLRRDLTVVNEIKTGANSSHSDISSANYEALHRKQRSVIDRVSKQARLLKDPLA